MSSEKDDAVENKCNQPAKEYESSYDKEIDVSPFKNFLEESHCSATKTEKGKTQTNAAGDSAAIPAEYQFQNAITNESFGRWEQPISRESIFTNIISKFQESEQLNVSEEDNVEANVSSSNITTKNDETFVCIPIDDEQPQFATVISSIKYEKNIVSAPFNIVDCTTFVKHSSAEIVPKQCGEICKISEESNKQEREMQQKIIIEPPAECSENSSDCTTFIKHSSAEINPKQFGEVCKLSEESNKREKEMRLKIIKEPPAECSKNSAEFAEKCKLPPKQDFATELAGLELKADLQSPAECCEIIYGTVEFTENSKQTPKQALAAEITGHELEADNPEIIHKTVSFNEIISFQFIDNSCGPDSSELKYKPQEKETVIDSSTLTENKITHVHQGISCQTSFYGDSQRQSNLIRSPENKNLNELGELHTELHSIVVCADSTLNSQHSSESSINDLLNPDFIAKIVSIDKFSPNYNHQSPISADCAILSCSQTYHAIQIEDDSISMEEQQLGKQNQQPSLFRRLYNIMIEFFASIYLCLQINKNILILSIFILAIIVSASFLVAFFYSLLNVSSVFIRNGSQHQAMNYDSDYIRSTAAAAG